MIGEFARMKYDSAYWFRRDFDLRGGAAVICASYTPEPKVPLVASTLFRLIESNTFVEPRYILIG